MEKCRSGQLNLPKNLKGNARDLVKLLLIDDPNQRLAISQLKEHSFFRGLDWQRLKNRQIDPPFRPELYRGIEHIFDDYIDTVSTTQPRKFNYEIQTNSPLGPFESPSPLIENKKLEDIIGTESHRNPIHLTKNKISETMEDAISSKNYSATGGTGEDSRKKAIPSTVLYQMAMINKAFVEF
jgi:hypothetical protein